MAQYKDYISPYVKYAPVWCKAKGISYCSQWKEEKPPIGPCRGCPHLKPEYEKKALGRFGDKQR